jgi:hypothetical protein
MLPIGNIIEIPLSGVIEKNKENTSRGSKGMYLQFKVGKHELERVGCTDPRTSISCGNILE